MTYHASGGNLWPFQLNREAACHPEVVERKTPFWPSFFSNGSVTVDEK
jgi:hypothetical protein